jgi:protease IV
MKNFLLGLITGGLICVLTVVILFFVAVRIAASFGERPVTVAQGTTLTVKLEDDVPETAAPEIPIPFFEEQSPATVFQVWETFRKAAADSRIKAVIFEPRGLSAGWARLQEIRQDIVNFKKSGKPIVTFLRGPGAREYYLASATDRIFMLPDETLDLKGLRVEAVYLKNTLDKVGVKMDVVHAGKYKDAGDIFTQTGMSPETREVLNAVLDQYYGNLVNVIAEGRRKQPGEVRAIIDQGPFMGKEAKANGLVDVLGYEDQMMQYVEKKLDQTNLNRLSSRSYLKIPAASVGLGGARRIALIVGEGDITRGSGRGGLDEEQGITASGLTKVLKKVENDASINGVILRVNSPGGDGVASDEILEQAKSLSKKKPLVISMSDLAASGGYFISMTGDPIVAYPNTLTGSIGVIFAKANLRGLYDKIGVNKQVLMRGRFAALDSDYEPLTPDEEQKLRQQIDEFYRVFVSRVADGRKRSYDQIEPLAQGRVWLGAQAKENGLVDQLGGLDRAIEMVKQRAHIPADENVTIVTYPPRRSVLDVLMNRSEDSASVELKAARRLFGGFPVGAWAQGGFLKLMPYVIKVQ